MSRPVHILPEKHVRISESILGVGAVVLRTLHDGPRSFDAVWKSMRHEKAIRDRLNGSVGIETLVLAIDFLYLLGAIRINSDERLELCD